MTKLAGIGTALAIFGLVVLGLFVDLVAVLMMLWIHKVVFIFGG